MLSSLFNSEAPFWRLMSSLVDILVLSLLWVFTSLPLVTLGAATTALYDASARCVRRGTSGAFTRYFSTFRRELIPSLIITLIFLAGLFLLMIPLRFFWAAVTANLTGARIALAAYAVFLVFPLGALCWVFPIFSRFTFTPLGAVKVSFQFSLGYLPRTFLLVLTLLATGLISALYWVPVLVLPCLLALLWSLVMEPLFARHAPADPPPDRPREP